jgi:outer membrane murein-binding lipoprotein Lpp
MKYCVELVLTATLMSLLMLTGCSSTMQKAVDELNNSFEEKEANERDKKFASSAESVVRGPKK